MAPKSSFAARIRGFDLYRKVPRDLTEPSVIGGALSLVAYAVLFILFIAEMRNFFSTSHVTSIAVDHTEDGIFQVNFNITIPGLSCEYASVDLRNVIGKKRENIKDRTVHKFSLDGTWQGSATHGDDIVHVYEGTDKDHYGNTRHAIELTAETFRQGIDEYEVLLVDFHAPWCSHCRNLAPIYEHAADLVKQRAPKEVDAHHRHSVALATLDCTVRENQGLCREHQIQGFPTILVFRQSKNKATGARWRGLELHESYTGVREAEPIADFAIQVLKDVQAGDKELQIGGGTDSTGDGKADSKLRTRGCRIDGFLMAQKVPGQIIIRPFSNNAHSFDTGLISVDHKINHLSFGNRKPSQVRKQINKNMDGAYAEHVGRPVILAEGEEEIGFTSTNDKPSTHEHYIKVVSTSLVPRRGKPVHAYEYTINSNTYESEDGIPEIVITFDLSPLKVLVTEVAKPWIDGLTSMCAILGGVFTCSIIFEGILSQTVLQFAKKLD